MTDKKTPTGKPSPLPEPLPGDAPNAAPILAELGEQRTYDRASTSATYRYLLGRLPFDKQPQSWDESNKLLRQASDMAAEYRVIRSGAKRPRGVGTTTTSFYETPLRCPVCGSGRERGQTYCREHVGSPEAKQGEALIVRVDDDA